MNKSTAAMVLEVSQGILREAIASHMAYLEEYAARFRNRYNRTTPCLPGFLLIAEEAEQESRTYGDALRALEGDPLEWFTLYGEAAKTALIYWRAVRDMDAAAVEGIEAVQAMIKGASL